MGDGLLPMVLPSSTRALGSGGDRSSPLHRIGKMPLSHPRLFKRQERLSERLWRCRAGGVPARAIRASAPVATRAAHHGTPHVWALTQPVPAVRA